jgi:hypothetical protein
MNPVTSLPVRPRPRLVSATPAVAVKNEFVQITPAMREAYGNAKALVDRLSRTFAGPFPTTTTAGLDAAEWQADELADVGHALARAIRKARR